MRNLRLKLADNWRRLHRSTTVILALLLSMLGAAQTYLPMLQDYIKPKHFAIISMVMGVTIAALRYVNQEAIKEKKEAPDEQK